MQLLQKKHRHLFNVSLFYLHVELLDLFNNLVNYETNVRVTASKVTWPYGTTKVSLSKENLVRGKFSGILSKMQYNDCYSLFQAKWEAEPIYQFNHGPKKPPPPPPPCQQTE